MVIYALIEKKIKFKILIYLGFKNKGSKSKALLVSLYFRLSLEKWKLVVIVYLVRVQSNTSNTKSAILILKCFNL